MGFYPLNPSLGQKIQTHADGVEADLSFPAHVRFSAAQALVALVTRYHAAVNGASGAVVEVTTGFTQPVVPCCVTCTAGGTAADIKATQVIVEGTDVAGNVITETLPVFTVDTAGTVTGTKAFATITKYTIPIQDGNGATFSLGNSEKLGLPYKLPHNTVLTAFHNNTKEGTAPTVTTSATDISLNTVDLNTALNGSVVDIYLLV